MRIKVSRNYKVRSFGPKAQGKEVTLPAAYTGEVGLESGDEVEMYRDPKRPDELIIKPVS